MRENEHSETEPKNAMNNERSEQAAAAETETTPPAKAKAAKKHHRWPALIALTLAVIAAAGCLAFVLYASNYYHADDIAIQELAIMESGETSGLVYGNTTTTGGDGNASGNDETPSSQTAVAEQPSATETDDSIDVGDPSSEYGLIIYPGAKIEPTAYVPLASKIAEQGVYCRIAKMPFNFAFFRFNKATALISSAPNVQHWWIAGHSLGGAMAAYYAGNNADKLEGVALLAAYSTADLNNKGLKALVIYGTEDGVLNRTKLQKNAGNLPEDTKTIEIEGGNHAGFGDYGAQKGDGAATISASEQQERTADAIVDAMRG